MWKCHWTQSNPLCLSAPFIHTFVCFIFARLCFPGRVLTRTRGAAAHWWNITVRHPQDEKHQRGWASRCIICSLCDHQGFVCNASKSQKSKVWKCFVNILLRWLLNSNPWFWWSGAFTSPQHEHASVCFSSSRYSCMFMCRRAPHS